MIERRILVSFLVGGLAVAITTELVERGNPALAAALTTFPLTDLLPFFLIVLSGAGSKRNAGNYLLSDVVGNVSSILSVLLVLAVHSNVSSSVSSWSLPGVAILSWSLSFYLLKKLFPG
jgi:hypothetical protein